MLPTNRRSTRGTEAPAPSARRTSPTGSPPPRPPPARTRARPPPTHRRPRRASTPAAARAAARRQRRTATTTTRLRWTRRVRLVTFAQLDRAAPVRTIRRAMFRHVPNILTSLRLVLAAAFFVILSFYQY